MSNADGHLQSLVGRIERLEEERKGLSGDIRALYKETKSAGFDLKILRLLIRERARDQAEIDEEAMLLDTYRRALGQLVGTPLADAAVQRAGTANIAVKAARRFVKTTQDMGRDVTISTGGMEPVTIRAGA